DRADAGQYADQRADHRADQAKKDVHGNWNGEPAHPRRQRVVHELEYDVKAEAEILKQLEHRDLTAPGNAGAAASAVPICRGTGTRTRRSGRCRRRWLRSSAFRPTPARRSKRSPGPK